MAGNVSSVGKNVGFVWKVGIVFSVRMGLGLEIMGNVSNAL